jgi:selenocysteine lyase/cysteine desulfurase
MAEVCRGALRERFELVADGGDSTLVSFVPSGDPGEEAARLYDAGVIVRDLPGTGWLRASCGWWTSGEDIDRLVGALG